MQYRRRSDPNKTPTTSDGEDEGISSIPPRLGLLVSSTDRAQSAAQPPFYACFWPTAYSVHLARSSFRRVGRVTPIKRQEGELSLLVGGRRFIVEERCVRGAVCV